MGARGPAPKPLELRLLEGGRDHRPVDVSAVFRPAVEAPQPPKWMSREARKAWARLVPELLRYNLLAAVDRDALSMLCQTIGRLDLIERSLAGRQRLAEAAGGDPLDALLDTTPNGLKVQAAAYQILNREQAKLHKMLENFGLRPDARARVTPGLRAQLQLFEGEQPAAGNAAKPDGWESF
jgi:P27 family predicted phage terminase small subunit